MSGFTKLHSGILVSTIWRECPSVKVVWITLLAMADQDGIIEATIPGLAAQANVSIEETETAIEKFLSPDKYSRTPDREGRRIEVIAGGWQLLNYQKYREKLSVEDRKRQAAVRQQRYRDRRASDAKRNAGVTGRDGDELVTRVTTSRSRSRKQSAEALNPKTRTRGKKADPAFDGEEQFNQTVALFPSDRRDYSRYAQDKFFSAISEIRESRSCDDSTAVEWLSGIVKRFVAAKGEFCPGFVKYLDSKPWKGCDGDSPSPGMKRVRNPETGQVFEVPE